MKIPRAALPVLLATYCGAALAAQDGATAPATAKAKPHRQVQAEASAPLSPRWVPPKWEIKGLVVWVFTPGHFQRD
ncbi:hypothetical protein V5F77_01970 [Xanthobacter sp. DSM 24535]|uniref:hypothetical protein n=1 Tax=Roseixanthobacter psychrophilus TaxID=3119917 RepID=UPI003729B4A2